MRTSKYSLMLALRRTRQQHTDSSRRLNAILEHVQDAVIEADERGGVTGWNARAEALLGWRRREVLKRDLTELLIPVEERPFFVLSDGAELQMPLQRKDGSRLDSELRIVSLRVGEERHWCLFIRGRPRMALAA